MFNLAFIVLLDGDKNCKVKQLNSALQDTISKKGCQNLFMLIIFKIYTFNKATGFVFRMTAKLSRIE